MRNIFLQTGIAQEDLVEWRQGHRTGISVYLSSAPRVQRLSRKFRVFAGDRIQCRIHRLKKEDWQERWKKGLRPFSLTKKIIVVPAWHKGKYPANGRSPLYIDTAMAFGTGLHETTRFMAQLIEECGGRFADFLDVGTGTGILTIAALRNGAKKAVALDLDPRSVQAASGNMALNQVIVSAPGRLRTSRMPAVGIRCCDVQAYRSQHRFEFVAANLHTYDLLKLKEKLASLVKPGKFLAVSGVSLEHLSGLRRGFQGLPLRCRRIKKGKKWAAVLYQRI